MFQSKVSAKEKFKEQIVNTVADIRKYYGDMKYQPFMNMVVMMDCLMETYKKDPEFIEKANTLLVDKQIDVINKKTHEIMGMISDNPLKRDRLYFVEWFKLLVGLANRTVFAGRMINVDIDLASVWDDYQRMTNFNKEKIESDIIERSMTDTHDQPQSTDDSANIEEIQVMEGVLD